MQLALPATRSEWIPDHIRPLGKNARRIYGVFWFALFLLAVIGPVAGVWYGLTNPAENSWLITGSRAGLALRTDDLTRVRYPIGDDARNAEVRTGDHIVAINGVHVSDVVPFDRTKHSSRNSASDTDYVLFGPILGGSTSVPLLITLRASDGSIRQLQTRAGESHMEEGARDVGLPPRALDVIGLLPVLAYPVFLWIAWALRRRASKDFVSSLLSVAILATIGSQYPSANFFIYIAHIPASWAQHLYDLGIMCFLSVLWLFPDASLRPRLKLIPLLGIGALPFLPADGDGHRTLLGALTLAGLVWVLARLRNAPPTMKQQIKYLILSILLIPALLSAALAAVSLEESVVNMGSQLALAAVAQLCVGSAMLSMNFGLYAGLVRYRLCDADAVISRSASVATLTIAATAIFAAIEGGVQSAFGGSAGVAPAVLAAAAVALLLKPLHGGVRDWADGRFQPRLVELRAGLPQCVEDLREIMSVRDIAAATVERTGRGVAATHVAILVGDAIQATHGIDAADVSAWLGASHPLWHRPRCDRKDGVFPLRVPLVVRHENAEPIGWLLVGPRYDESFYSKEEQAVLFGIADPVARALQIAQTRERRAVAEQHRMSGIDGRLAQLESAVSELLGRATKPPSRRRLLPS